MEKINGGPANSGQVGRKLSTDDKAVIMWALDSLADNSTPYVKEVRMVIDRQITTAVASDNKLGLAAKLTNIIRIRKGVSPEFLVWMREDQRSFVKGVVKVMLNLCVDRYFADKLSAKSRYFEEYRKCGILLDKL